MRDGGEHSYSEVCRILKDNNTKSVWDDDAKVRYAVRDALWISFEDKESVRYKAIWIRQNRFGGSMLYSLNNDDIDGECDSQSQAFVLSREIAAALGD